MYYQSNINYTTTFFNVTKKNIPGITIPHICVYKKVYIRHRHFGEECKFKQNACVFISHRNCSTILSLTKLPQYLS